MKNGPQDYTEEICHMTLSELYGLFHHNDCQRAQAWKTFYFWVNYPFHLSPLTETVTVEMSPALYLQSKVKKQTLIVKIALHKAQI